MKAFAYLRVSGVSQVDGDGFPRQREAIESYAARNGYEIAAVFEEKGISGATDMDNRPALQAMLIELLADSVHTVLIERLDRLARDLMVQERIITDFERRGFHLISVHEPDLLANDPSRKLMRQIFGAIAEYDRVMLVAKLKAARDRKRAATGRCGGRKPYGWHGDEGKIVDRIDTLRGEGLTIVAIADKLNREGKKLRGGGRWTPSQVWRVLSRAQPAAPGEAA